MARLAELEADRQLHHAEKAAAREAKLAAFESIREEEKRQAATEAVAMEEHRRARAGVKWGISNNLFTQKSRPTAFWVCSMAQADYVPSTA